MPNLKHVMYLHMLNERKKDQMIKESKNKEN